MTAAKDPYANLADLYDSMANNEEIDRFRSRWRDRLLSAIQQYQTPVKVLVDLACGTGSTAIPWTKQKNWKVIGVDQSPAMLREARKKSRRVRWIRQDIGKLDLDVKADVVTCHFDALNHILRAAELQTVFGGAARILNKGGLFQFDLSTDFWFRWLSVREKLGRFGNNYCMSTNAYDARKRIATFNQLWFVKQGSVYRKREIKVQEAAYTRSQVRSMLRKAGFGTVKISPDVKIEGKTARLLYLARKS
jgi:ubiquinone/menaquinone biosynthesis C-methylase UbiE